MITSEQLKKIMPNAGIRVDKYLPYLVSAMEKCEIDTPLRMAHFLAQIAHESGELRYTEEIASGRAYEGRKDLGNVFKGDGVRFKGRGLIQLTGRANYRRYKEWSGVDVVANPKLLSTPRHATLSACWFWQSHKLNALADIDNGRAITRRINGGYNGFAQRMTYLKRAKEVLS